MKFNKWTVALAAVGVVSLASAARADEHLSQVQTALSNTTISGYVDVSAQWNLGKQNSGPIAPYSYSTSAGMPYSGKSDGFNLNVVDLALDKPLDQSQWASGYHVELAIGPDGGTLGTDTRYTDNGNFAIRQAYIALRTPVGNGIDWKVGVFDSPLGYESTSSPLDPNYTRSYGYTIEPTELTGVLATYKVNDIITAQAGVVNDLSARINSRLPYESQKAILGVIALTAPDSAGWMKGATLNMGVANAPSRASGSTSWYLGATLPTPSAKLKVGTAFDYLDVHNGAGSGTTNPHNDSEWVAGLYANFQATDKLSLNLRGEYLSNDGAGAGIYASSNGYYGAAEELTATVQYSLWANVLSRLELRWDHVEHHKAFDYTPSHSAVAHENALMLALNLIYQF
jgi:hypothetical protein